MAQRIKGKFIDADAVSGSKIKLLEGEALRIAEGNNVIDLLKVMDGKVMLKGAEVGYKTDVSSEASARLSADQALQTAIDGEASARASGDLAAVASAKDYTDGKVTELNGRIDNVLSNVDGAALDSLTEVVQAFQAADSSLNGAITSLSQSATSALNQEISDRQAAVSAEATARQNADQALQTSVSALSTSVTGVQSDLSDLDAYAQDVRSDLDALDARVVILEGKNSAPLFDRESFVAAEPLTYIDLSREVIANSLNVFVDRLALHQGVDYSVSVVAGKTRLTWIGDFAVGGVEQVQVNDKIFVTYAYAA